MKKLELQQMEKIEGGWNKCSWYGVAAVGFAVGSLFNPMLLVPATSMTIQHLAC